MANLQAIADSVINGQAPAVSQAVQEAIDENMPVQDILHEGLIAGMNVVGVKFKNNEFYIPEVLIAARAMKSNLLAKSASAPSKVICTTLAKTWWA